jgi:hypothetical protein
MEKYLSIMSSRKTSNVNNAKAVAAYRIFLSPVFLYVEIDSNNNIIEKIPIKRLSKFSTIPMNSSCNAIPVKLIKWNSEAKGESVKISNI